MSNSKNPIVKKGLQLFNFLKKTYQAWDSTDPFARSAIIAYYTLFSLPSLCANDYCYSTIWTFIRFHINGFSSFCSIWIVSFLKYIHLVAFVWVFLHSLPFMMICKFKSKILGKCILLLKYTVFSIIKYSSFRCISVFFFKKLFFEMAFYIT